MPSIIGMMQVPEATRVKSTKWAMVGYSAALVALSVVSVVLQGDPFSQHIGSLSPSGKGGGNILLSTGPQQQLAAVASEGSSASRKLLQCGECGCGVACPGGGGGATQVNMVGFGGGLMGGGMSTAASPVSAPSGPSMHISMEAAEKVSRLKDRLSSLERRITRESSAIAGLKLHVSEVEKERGPRGPRGKTGAPGHDGHNGHNGRPGRPGHDGHDGHRGKRGKRGRRGRRGHPGHSGHIGHRGRRGRPGHVGMPGARGKRGRPGHDGHRGRRGRRGRTGKAGHDGKRGKNGHDGKPGHDGKAGHDGHDGKPGKNGHDGHRGRPGKNGHDGKPGHDGKAGHDGHDGKPGKNGHDGHDGKPGHDGHDGKPGHDYRARRAKPRPPKHWRRHNGWEFKVLKGPRRGGMTRVPVTDGMDVIGKKRMSFINLGSVNDFKLAVPGTPRSGNFAWEASGTVVIRKGGRYTFCTRSDDGSKLWINRIFLVSNDGLHGPRTRCGHITMRPGSYGVQGTGFQRGGGAYMAIQYSGPDTDGKRILLGSSGLPRPDKRPPRWRSRAGWRFSVFKGPSGMTRVISVKGLRRIGKVLTNKIDLRSPRDFKRLVPGTPNDNFVWEALGTVVIFEGGRYKFCTTSDDGSKLKVSNTRVVNNDGLHGARRRCGHITLTRGEHPVEATGFQRGGGAYMSIRWQGPDTHNQLRLLGSKRPPRADTLVNWAKTNGWRFTTFKGPRGMHRVPSIMALRAHKLGSVRLEEIDMRSWHAMRRVIRNTPHNDYAWRAAGTVDILERGTYTFCTTSDDGSKLYIRDRLYVNNDGLHGARTRCRSVYLNKGHWPVVGTGFQRGGGAYFRIRYKGPDTGGKLLNLQSSGPGRKLAQLRDWKSSRGWRMTVYKGPSRMGRVPGVTGLDKVTSKRMKYVSLRNWGAFSRTLPGTPRANFVWKNTGTVRIITRGRYHFCTTSDDGSKMWVNHRYLVSNDGLHGARTRCGGIHLNPGSYPVMATGFQRGGGAYMSITYQGPDTLNHRVLLGSSDPGPKEKEPVRWQSRVGWRWSIYKGQSHMRRVIHTKGLAKLASTRMSKIDMHNVRAFKQAIHRTPHSDFVWKGAGITKIFKEGRYYFCTRSDDGSKIYVNDRLVANDDGLHGPRTRCGHIHLKPGEAEVKVLGFQRGGGAYERVRYRGPDTGQNMKYLGSARPPRSKDLPIWQKTQGWRLTVYRGPGGMRRVPSTTGLYDNRLGSTYLSHINLHNWHAFRRAVRRTPRSNFVWKVTGTVKINEAGRYTFCTTSDDGSKLYVDGSRVVNNDGLHGPTRRCGWTDLSKGSHPVKGVGFQRGGGAYMRVSYRGKDTGNNMLLLGSSGPGPADVRPPRWDKSHGWRFSIFKAVGHPYRTPHNSRGLTKMGDSVDLTTIDLRNQAQIKSTIHETPNSNYVFRGDGTLVVQIKGWYTFCTTSDDGSLFYVNRQRVVSNDGLHGPRRRCGRKYLQKGSYVTRMMGFQRGGGAYIRVTYKGPQTGNIEKLLGSSGKPALDKLPPKWESSNGWRFTVYKGPPGMSRLPRGGTKGLSRVRSIRMRTVNLRSIGEFKRVIPGTPSSNFVWKATGTIHIWDDGKYKFCTTSDDGSKLYINTKYPGTETSIPTDWYKSYRQVVNNDGLHGARRRCGYINLKRGKYFMKSLGFQRGGGAYMRIMYQGPDTGGHLIYTKSSEPPKSTDAPDWSSQRGWRFTVYRGPHHMTRVPRVRGLVSSSVKTTFLGSIDMSSWYAMRSAVPQLPRSNFVWKASGHVKITEGGSYRFCTRSDDGSKLWVDGDYVINNDGLHGARTRCGRKTMKPGTYLVKSTGFQRGGGANMRITYDGPDTGGNHINLRSSSPGPADAPQRMWQSASGWRETIYKGPNSMSRVPSVAGLKRIGSARMQYIGQTKNHDFVRAVPGTPHDHFVWRDVGEVDIQFGGKYTFCTTSDDGSILLVKGQKVVNNDGLHGTRKRCGSITLSRGVYPVDAEGFQRGGHAYMKVTYKGQDTGGIEKPLGSVKPPPAKKAVDWSRPDGWRFTVYLGPHGMTRVVPTQGLRKVGSARLGRIALTHNNAFKNIISGTPNDNFVWSATGTVKIEKSGRYTFCTRSDDGSKLWVDGHYIVNNDGLHSQRSRCGSRHLRSGSHFVKSLGFQRGGSAYMRIMYQGPDTGNARIYLRSSAPGPMQQNWASSRGWKMIIYSGPRHMKKTPNTAYLTRIGTANLRTVDLHSHAQFRKYVSRTPSSYFVWKFIGKVRIVQPGTYKWCTTSDDGSSLSINGPGIRRRVVGNDGLHGARTRCSNVKMKSGDYRVVAPGFQSGGSAFMRVRYSGPDTDFFLVPTPAMWATWLGAGARRK